MQHILTDTDKEFAIVLNFKGNKNESFHHELMHGNVILRQIIEVKQTPFHYSSIEKCLAIKQSIIPILILKFMKNSRLSSFI